MAGSAGEVADVGGDDEAAAGDFGADEFGGLGFALGDADHLGGDDAGFGEFVLGVELFAVGCGVGLDHGGLLRSEERIEHMRHREHRGHRDGRSAEEEMVRGCRFPTPVSPGSGSEGVLSAGEMPAPLANRASIRRGRGGFNGVVV